MPWGEGVGPGLDWHFQGMEAGSPQWARELWGEVALGGQRWTDSSAHPLVWNSVSWVFLCQTLGTLGFSLTRVFSSQEVVSNTGCEVAHLGLPLPMNPLLRWHLPQRVDIRVKIVCALLWPSAQHSESLMSDSYHCPRDMGLSNVKREREIKMQRKSAVLY